MEGDGRSVIPVRHPNLGVIFHTVLMVAAYPTAFSGKFSWKVRAKSG
jgi:hypothetical protein